MSLNEYDRSVRLLTVEQASEKTQPYFLVEMRHSSLQHLEVTHNFQTAQDRRDMTSLIFPLWHGKVDLCYASSDWFTRDFCPMDWLSTTPFALVVISRVRNILAFSLVLLACYSVKTLKSGNDNSSSYVFVVSL